MCFVSHTVPCFQDLLAGCLATALPQKRCALYITYSTLFSGPVSRPFGHCLTPKPCALSSHIIYSALFSGPVCLPVGHSLTPKHCLPHITCSTLLSGPVCLPVGFCFFPNIVCFISVLYPVFRISLPAIWPLPHPKMLCTSYHIRYSVFGTSLLAIRPLPHLRTLCTSYHLLYPLFRTNLLAR